MCRAILQVFPVSHGNISFVRKIHIFSCICPLNNRFEYLGPTPSSRPAKAHAAATDPAMLESAKEGKSKVSGSCHLPTLASKTSRVPLGLQPMPRGGMPCDVVNPVFSVTENHTVRSKQEITPSTSCLGKVKQSTGTTSKCSGISLKGLIV